MMNFRGLFNVFFLQFQGFILLVKIKLNTLLEQLKFPEKVRVIKGFVILLL